MRIWVLGAVCGLAVSGCAKAKAAPLPDAPPLAMPAPPPRVLAPVDNEPLASLPLPTEPTAAASTPQQASPAPSRRPVSKEAEKQEPAVTAVAPPAPVAPPPAEPARELRTVDAAAEQKVRDLLTRAKSDLSRVDYQRLSTDGRSQYDESKRFADRAEEALKERNTIFAATLADKAATLAAELLRR